MKRATEYAKSIVDGTRLSSAALMNACTRFLSDIERDDLYIDEQLLKRILKVIETKLKTDDGSNIKLYPFQVFLIANIFGFYYEEDNRRRCEEALLFFPRGVGKSFIASIIGIIDMLFPVKGDKNYPQVILAANTHKQAGEVYDAAKSICRNSTSDFRLKFVIPKSAFKHQGVLQFKPTKATMSTISSDSDSSEGMMPSCFVVDEIHAMKNDLLLTSLEYAGAKRESPLGVYISTAGDQIDGVLHEKYKAHKAGLADDTIPDTTFSLIYDLDQEDMKDWENCLTNGSLEKVNPLYGMHGQSKVKRTYEKRRKELDKEPSKTAQFKTKMLNMFIESKNKWINRSVVNAKMKPLDLENYRGWNAWVGIDLAKKNDLTAISVLLVKDDQYRLFNRAYIPQTTADKLDNNLFWKTMMTKGYLEITEGASTTYEPMIQWLNGFREGYDINVMSVLYDNYNAEFIIRRLDEEGYDAIEHKQSHAAFNSAVCTMETLLLDTSSDLLIDYNPLTGYCFDNVILDCDPRGNYKPNKTNPHKKIDIAISALQALGGYSYSYANGEIGGGGVFTII